MLKELDELVNKFGYRSRYELIQEAIADKIAELKPISGSIMQGTEKGDSITGEVIICEARVVSKPILMPFRKKK